MTGRAERELRVEAEVAAPPGAVWAVLADVRRMAEWSPELVSMLPLKRGGLRRGQWYLGVNRRGAAVWPTRSVVSDVEPGRLLAWDTPTSGARWIWELDAVGTDGATTRVVHRRPVPGTLPWSARVFARIALGGVVEHADELEAGMAVSVERLAHAVTG